MKQILNLVNKHFNKDFDISDYEKVDLFSIKNPNSFQRFLIKDRIQVFQKLHVLAKLCKDEIFFIGCEDLFYDWYCDEEEDCIEVGPCLILTEFSREDVFNKLVSDLAIAQIDVPTYHHIFDSDIACVNKVDRPDGYQQSATKHVLISENFILVSDSLYVRNSKKDAEALFEGLNPIFSKFIVEQKDPVGVSHDIYIDWLLKWFPGKVKIRTLTYSGKV